MKKNNTQFLILSSLLAILFVAGFFFVVDQVNNVNEKTDALKTELVDAQVKLLKAESLRRVALSGEDEIEKIEKFVVNAGGEVEAVQQIEGLARASGLTYTTEFIIAKDHLTLSSQHKELLNIVITTTGGWRATEKFTALIENLPYNVKIDGVDMQLISGDGAQGAGQWKTKYDISLVKKKEA